MNDKSSIMRPTEMQCLFEPLEIRTLLSVAGELSSQDTAAIASVTPAAATGPLTQKFITQVTVSTSDVLERQFMPVMGDINNDGTQEIVLTAGDSLYAINGKTGVIEWRLAGEGDERAPELADLNNDGVPEILYSLSGNRLRAVNGNGTILWTTSKLRGGYQSLFPILTADLDKDGLPTIYFFGQGGVSMIDNTGKVLPQWAFVSHPCWGGGALADPNNDGHYVLYVGDRSSAYGGVGVAAFDALTLKPLWNRPDIHHSSPMPIIADANNDGKLEVVAEKIVNQGPMVLNATTGQTIADYSNKHLPCHGVGTVYDIDQDGHQEIMLGTGYGGGGSSVYSVPNEFAVFDLVDGTTDFRPKLDYPATWPPRVGDVTGDGQMEILAAMGFQWDRVGTSPLLVYDSHFNLIQRLDLNRSGQLSPEKIFDTDSDGLNEVVVVGKAGKVYVFDTPAPTPNPAPRTWVQGYSELRDNVPVYTPPPGGTVTPPTPVNHAPTISGQSPKDNGVQVALTPTLSANIADSDNDNMDISIELGITNTEGGVDWQTLASFTGVSSGTYTAPTDGLVTQTGTRYQWRVTAVDATGLSTQKTFAFTTTYPVGENWYNPWAFRRAVTVAPGLAASDLTDYPLLVDVTLPELAAAAQSNGADILFTASDGVTKLDHEVESYDPATGHLIAWVRMPTLSSADGAQLYLYYGNPDAAAQQNASGTWDSGYRAVEHFEEVAGAVTDSSGNAQDGTVSGATRGTAGVVGNAYSFDGVNDRVDLPQLYTTQKAFTIEGWIKPGNHYGYTFFQRTGSTGVVLQYYSPSKQLELYVGSTKIVAPATTGNWYHVVATYDGTTATLYLNGKLVKSTVASLTWPALASLMGDNRDHTRALLGQLDEWRMSTVARSGDYASAVYHNSASPSSYMSVGQEEVPTAPVI